MQEASKHWWGHIDIQPDHFFHLQFTVQSNKDSGTKSILVYYIFIYKLQSPSLLCLILLWLSDPPDKILLIFCLWFCLAKDRFLHLISLSPICAIQPCPPLLAYLITCPEDLFPQSPYKSSEGRLESYCSNLRAFGTHHAQVWGSAHYT